jgi:hypothetical protein
MSASANEFDRNSLPSIKREIWNDHTSFRDFMCPSLENLPATIKRQPSSDEVSFLRFYQ